MRFAFAKSAVTASMTKTYAIENIVSNIDIADRLGVAQSVVSNWQKRDVDFPKPIGMVGRRPVWDWERVAQWQFERGETAAEKREKRITKLRAELARLEKMEK